MVKTCKTCVNTLERLLFTLSMVITPSLKQTATTTTKKKQTNLYPRALQCDCVLLFWIICHQFWTLSANNIRGTSLFCIIAVRYNDLSLKQRFIHKLKIVHTYLLKESYIPCICEKRDCFYHWVNKTKRRTNTRLYSPLTMPLYVKIVA